MGELFLLSERQMARISPHFPLSHGVARVDDRGVVSEIVYLICNGIQWKDARRASVRARRSTTASYAGAGGRVRPHLRRARRRRAEAQAHHDRRDASESPIALRRAC